MKLIYSMHGVMSNGSDVLAFFRHVKWCQEKLQDKNVNAVRDTLKEPQPGSEAIRRLYNVKLDLESAFW